MRPSVRLSVCQSPVRCSVKYFGLAKILVLMSIQYCGAQCCRAMSCTYVYCKMLCTVCETPDRSRLAHRGHEHNMEWPKRNWVNVHRRSSINPKHNNNTRSTKWDQPQTAGCQKQRINENEALNLSLNNKAQKLQQIADKPKWITARGKLRFGLQFINSSD